MNVDDRDNEYQVISVDIFASFSIRNILPEDIEWEVSNEKLSESSVERQIVDGSTLWRGYVEDQDESIIKSGNREEVLSCDLLSMSFKVRFRCKSVYKWTEWVSINSKAANAEDLNTGNLNSTVESNDGAYYSFLFNFRLAILISHTILCRRAKAETYKRTNKK